MFRDCSDKVKGRRFSFTVVARAGRTADPSAPLRFGRDDKSEGGRCNRDLLVDEWKSGSLHFAPPDFLLSLVAVANLMRLSLKKAANVALSGSAQQEIRVRFGRDDKV